MVRYLGYSVADYMETIEHLSPIWLQFIQVAFEDCGFHTVVRNLVSRVKLQLKKWSQNTIDWDLTATKIYREITYGKTSIERHQKLK